MTETHFVRITFEPVSEAEINILLGEDERLNQVFSDRLVVEYDGYDRGTDRFAMFLYGTNADQMASLIFPELRGPIRSPSRGFQAAQRAQRSQRRNHQT